MATLCDIDSLNVLYRISIIVLLGIITGSFCVARVSNYLFILINCHQLIQPSSHSHKLVIIGLTIRVNNTVPSEHKGLCQDCHPEKIQRS